MGDIDYQTLELEYQPLTTTQAQQHPFVVVGAGPVGLSMALDYAQRGHKVIVLDEGNRLSVGSRAICFAQRTLDIWDRLGVGERMVQKGVSWNVGKVFFKDEEVWSFNLLAQEGYHRPAFINLQQYYCEGYLYEAAAAHPNIELRWKNKAVALQQHDTSVDITVATPDGEYMMTADWLVACDGARSPLRKMLGQESHGRTFHDRFLIADVKMTADFPAQRWFWFDPPFHPNQSVLLHSQPDNIWRIDFQLGWDADPVEEVKPENVLPRVRALLGKDTDFELEWVSIYTFSCARMDTFRHGRVLFAGDSAHRVSPFGARGANSGVQDTDNLAWKLDLVTRGLAPDSLIDSYSQEREFAAAENLLNSSRSTDFITPKSEISRLFRDTVLTLAKQYDFARKLVNSGRLSTPTFYKDSPLNTPDSDDFNTDLPVGAPTVDAPVSRNGKPAWWLDQTGGNFVLALFCTSHIPSAATVHELARLQDHPAGLKVVLVLNPVLAQLAPTGLKSVIDEQGLLTQRHDAHDGSCYLLRPDQHIAARWRRADPARINAALQRAIGIL
ncbi:MAG: FAD-dependent oxidoreductase [Burkholderiaceae bacterium]|nr:FAD-dependent oxidoreductase [Burkholderiaceae bacterium]